MHNYRELKVWRESIQMAKEVYILTRKFPREEMFQLTSQIRRAAVSVASNIAEGCGRRTNKDLVHFLDISTGSAFELDTQLAIALELGYINKGLYDNITSQIDQVQKMLYRLTESFINKKK